MDENISYCSTLNCLYYTILFYFNDPILEENINVLIDKFNSQITKIFLILIIIIMFVFFKKFKIFSNRNKEKKRKSKRKSKKKSKKKL